MTAQSILAELLERGIEPEVTADRNGITVPAGVLTDSQRQAIRANKPELIALILESSRITHELLQAAMRACDHYGDSDKARQDMREQILATPPHLRADLLDHFQRSYPAPAKPAARTGPPRRGGRSC